MKVFVTGAAGFVGRYVAREFAEQGHLVSGLGWGKFPESSQWGLYHWYEGSVTLDNLIEWADKPDVIVHCAGGSSVAYSVEYPRQDFSLTVDSTSQVLEYIRLHSPQTRLVYPSSAAVYGNVEQLPIQESFPLQPISPYGVHKAMCEQLCEMYFHNYGVSSSVVRLFSVYGRELRKQLLWDACNKLLRQEYEFFGTGEELRDWLHVTDAARLIVTMALSANDSFDVFNGGTGQGVRVRDVLQQLFDAFKVESAPVFSNQAKTGDPVGLVADSQALKKLAWKPEVELQSGIQDYVQWFHQSQ